MKRLSELKPPPKTGEWYSVLPNENGTTRVVILIDSPPNIARIPYAGVSGIAYFFDPKKLTKEKAREALEQEIKSMEEEQLISSDKDIAEIFIRDMRQFYKNHFEEQAIA